MSSYPTTIPDTIQAGSNLDLAVEVYNDYGTQLTNDDGYTAYLVLNNASGVFSASTTTDHSQGFLFQIAGSVTSAWTAGDYQATVYADDGTNRYYAASSWVTVKADPITSGAYDARSTARQTLDAIDAAILGQATSNQLAMSIAGRSIQRMSMVELLTAKSKFEELVSREQKAEDMANGVTPKNSFKIRWV